MSIQIMLFFLQFLLLLCQFCLQFFNLSLFCCNFVPFKVCSVLFLLLLSSIVCNFLHFRSNILYLFLLLFLKILLFIFNLLCFFKNFIFLIFKILVNLPFLLFFFKKSDNLEWPLRLNNISPELIKVIIRDHFFGVCHQLFVNF